MRASAPRTSLLYPSEPQHTQSRGRAWADPCLGDWRCRAAPSVPICLWDSAFGSKENSVCPGRPFHKKETEGFTFLLPEGCGETRISHAPKHLKQELVFNPDLLLTGTALYPQLPADKIFVTLRARPARLRGISTAHLNDFYELELFCIQSHHFQAQKKDPGFYLKVFTPMARCASSLWDHFCPLGIAKGLSLGP